MPKIIIEPFQKAVLKLEEILIMPKDEVVRDAAVQRFEYTYELAWKMIKRFLKEVYNQDTDIFVEMLKNAAKVGLIDDYKAWQTFRQIRNYTSHNYSENGADFSYSQARVFVIYARNLANKLEEICNQIHD
jgi:nucleotidyltransferase substrate binding protein (TIGR01987 family)